MPRRGASDGWDALRADDPSAAAATARSRLACSPPHGCPGPRCERTGPPAIARRGGRSGLSRPVARGAPRAPTAVEAVTPGVASAPIPVHSTANVLIPRESGSSGGTALRPVRTAGRRPDSRGPLGPADEPGVRPGLGPVAGPADEVPLIVNPTIASPLTGPSPLAESARACRGWGGPPCGRRAGADCPAEAPPPAEAARRPGATSSSGGATLDPRRSPAMPNDPARPRGSPRRSLAQAAARSPSRRATSPAPDHRPRRGPPPPARLGPRPGRPRPGRTFALGRRPPRRLRPRRRGSATPRLGRDPLQPGASPTPASATPTWRSPNSTRHWPARPANLAAARTWPAAGPPHASGCPSPRGVSRSSRRPFATPSASDPGRSPASCRRRRTPSAPASPRPAARTCRPSLRSS